MLKIIEKAIIIFSVVLFLFCILMVSTETSSSNEENEEMEIANEINTVEESSDMNETSDVEESDVTQAYDTMSVEERRAIEGVQNAPVYQLFGDSVVDAVFVEGTTYGDILDEKYFGFSEWKCQKTDDTSMYAILFRYDQAIIDGQLSEPNEDGLIGFGFVWDEELGSCLPINIFSGETRLADAFDYEPNVEIGIAMVSEIMAGLAKAWATDLLDTY